MSVVWALYGYSLAFSNGGSSFNGSAASTICCLNGVSRTWDERSKLGSNPDVVFRNDRDLGDTIFAYDFSRHVLFDFAGDHVWSVSGAGQVSWDGGL